MTKTAAIESLFATLLTGDTSVLPELDAAIGDGFSEGGKVFMPIVQRGYKRGSHVVGPKRVPARYAVVTPGKSIRLVGLAYPGKGDMAGDQRAYDRTFSIGDTAEYDSFNMSYHGEITSIGKGGNVTVAHPYSKRSTRLDAEQFTWRNYDLDLAAAAQRNHDVMMHC